MSKYISIEYDEPNLKPEPSRPYCKPDKPSKDKAKENLAHWESSMRELEYDESLPLYRRLMDPEYKQIIMGSYKASLEIYEQWDQKYRDQEMQDYERRMQEYERQMQECEDFERNPYFFQKRTALIDVENKDFKFFDEVIFDYGWVFPQIKVFNQKNRKSLTFTFKDNEQYQKAKSQIIQAIT